MAKSKPSKTVVARCSTHAQKPCTMEVPLAYTNGLLGVAHAVNFNVTHSGEVKEGWLVYHIPTGLGFPYDFEEADDAIKACDFASGLRSSWDAGLKEIMRDRAVQKKWLERYPRNIR